MRLNTMETSQRRAPTIEYINEAKREEIEVKENVAEEAAQDLLIKFVSKIRARVKIGVPMYEGNLEVEELLDWIRSMEKYFDYEDIKEDNMVKHAMTRLKGHAVLWWDELQFECRSNGKYKIKSWDMMVAKMKDKFILNDYQIDLFKKL
jgi:hypothetical protein